jgi:hypothetical protein
MIYYTSSELSDKLSINPSRWKRWVRDFLAPDPLGGIQSGYARQLSLKEAFIVFLGGFLVSELRFGVQEAGRILADLSPWLKKKGYFRLHIQNAEAAGIISSCEPATFIHIFRHSGQGFCYTIREVISEEPSSQKGVIDQKYKQTLIGTDSDPQYEKGSLCSRTVAITTLYALFLAKVMG